MPKVLVVGSLPQTLDPWISHLTVQNIEVIKTNKLSLDQQIGLAKLSNVDAVFLVISNTLRADYLKNDCAEIKAEFAKAAKQVPDGTPVFIVLANSTEKEQENFKEKFASVEGIIEGTHERVSLYQVGQKNPKHVHDIFGYSERKEVYNFSNIDHHLKPEFLQKIKGTIKYTALPRSINSSSGTVAETGKPKNPVYKKDKRGEDTDKTKKEEPQATKNKAQSPDSQLSSSELKNSILIASTSEEINKSLNSSEVRENNKKNHRDGVSKEASGEGPYPQESQTAKPLLKPQVKLWEMGFPLRIMGGTLLGLALLVGIFELVGLIVDSIIVPAVATSLLMKCGLLASLISGTALASLTPLGVIAIGILIVTLIAGIAAFCYVNREKIFAATPSNLPPDPLEDNKERQGVVVKNEEKETPTNLYTDIYQASPKEGAVVLNENEASTTHTPTYMSD